VAPKTSNTYSELSRIIFRKDNFSLNVRQCSITNIWDMSYIVGRRAQ